MQWWEQALRPQGIPPAFDLQGGGGFHGMDVRPNPQQTGTPIKMSPTPSEPQVNTPQPIQMAQQKRGLFNQGGMDMFKNFSAPPMMR